MPAINLARIGERFLEYFSTRKLHRALDRRTAARVSEIAFGLLRSADTRISEVARGEVPENADREDFKAELKNDYYFFEEAQWDPGSAWDCHLQPTCRDLSDRVHVAVDYTAIAKKYSKKIENLQYIYDGRLKKTVLGIKVLVSAAIERRKNVRFLRIDPTSSRENHHKSENAHILSNICSIEEHLQGKGVYVMDRGMDRKAIITPLLDDEIDFIIRLKCRRGCRHLWNEGGSKKRSVAELSRTTPCSIKGPIVNYRHRSYQTWLGVRRVRWKKTGPPLYLVVSRIPGVATMVLLTSVRTEKPDDVIRRVEGYIDRNKVEEVIRFLKTDMGMERFMIRGWEGIRRLLWILTMAADFLGSIRRLGGRLKRAICAMGKPIYEEKAEAFPYYRLRRGIAAIFTVLLISGPG
jgi:hypothetical protein